MDYLSLCLCVKDEDEDYLREWVDYHILIGVERFFIYDNGSRVRVRETLAEYVADGRVFVVDAPDKGVQQTAYAHCLHYLGPHTRWLGFIDADEFFVLKTTQDLRQFLTLYEDYGGLGVHWVMFGSSGHIEKPPGSQIKNFILAAPPDFQPNNFIKSIVQPQYAVYPGKVHHFFYKAGYHVVNENYVKITGFETPRTVEKIQLNHYFTRSREQFRKKVERGTADNAPRRTMDEFYGYDNAAIHEDRCILDLVEKLLPDGDLTKLHQYAASKPKSEKQVFSVYPVVKESHVKMEVEIMADIVELACAANDIRSLLSVYNVAQLRFNQLVWFNSFYIKTVDIVWAYYMQAGEYAQAAIISKEAVAHNPYEISFQKRRAVNLSMEGNSLGAETAWHSVLARDPQDIDTLVSLGKLYYDTGRYDQALTHLQAALKFNTKDQDALDGLNLVLVRMQ